MTYDLFEEVSDLKTKAENHIDKFSTEINHSSKTVVSCKKLNDMQQGDNSRLRDDLVRLKNENMLLSRETSMLENDSGKLRNENDQLRRNIIKLDKIVYGVANSSSSSTLRK